MKNLSTAKISVLDLAKVSQGQTIAETYQASKTLAQHVERLGYTRFWLAEHHGLEGITSAATSVLIGYIAENTKTIRVGSGGIMLPNHAPMVIAEQFGTLATLYPNRIDLGLGRAPGSDRTTMRALRRDHPNRGDDFAELIQELRYFFAPATEGQELKAIPGAGIDVPMTILGSSLYSAQLAASLGWPYAFAGHFAPGEMLKSFEMYRANFKPSVHLKTPYVMVGCPVIAADTDEHADFLATSLQQAFLGMVRGHRKFSVPPVKDMDAIWSEAERVAVHRMLALLTVGSVQSVRQGLDQIIELTGADELIITSDTYRAEDRLRSFELIVQAKALSPAAGKERTIEHNLR